MFRRAACGSCVRSSPNGSQSPRKEGAELSQQRLPDMRPATPIAWRRREARRLVEEAAKKAAAATREEFRRLAVDRARLKWDGLGATGVQR